MRRLVRWFWITVALVFLFEAWLWDHLQPTRRLDRRPAAAAPPQGADLEMGGAAVAGLVADRFIVPLGLLLPFKLAGLWLLARGYWMGAAGTLFFAKIVGLGSTAFVFDAARQKLLQLGWFRRLYDIVMAWRAWAHRARRSGQGAHQGAHGDVCAAPGRPRRAAAASHPPARAHAAPCREAGAAGSGRDVVAHSTASGRRAARTGRCR